MDTPLVILIGFSTAGKSYYLNKIMQEYPNEYNYFDSDRIVAEFFDCHIYNIFMALGRDEALKYIEKKEAEFINFISTERTKPTIVAAGPFLVVRSEWEELVNRRKPTIIYLEKNLDSIYTGLLSRRNKQKENLDTTNSNFGSWDDDVTTKLENGLYVDLPQELAIANIEKHLTRVIPFYKRHSSHIENSNILEKDATKSQQLVDLIISFLNNKN